MANKIQKSLLSLILISFSWILFISFASADVSLTANFKSGIIKADGIIANTNEPLSGVGIISVICTSPNCATVSGTLWNPQTISGSSTTLTYPTTLLSGNGYGIYIYKNGFIPYEINSRWAGSGTAPAQTYIPAKKESCKSSLGDIEVSYDTGTITASGFAHSPIENSGPLEFQPPELESYYEATVFIKMSSFKNNQLVSEELQELRIPFSDTQRFQFNIPAEPGDYVINFNSSVIDPKCLGFVSDLRQENYTVAGPIDTTPPRPIINLRIINKGTSFLAWSWNNPPEIDFNNNKIYIDGALVSNDKLLTYTAIGLQPATTHTICVKTADTSGNVNENQVCNSDSTNPENPGDTTPPGPVTNMKITQRGFTYLMWNWTNPSDSDFNHNMIFLDNVHVSNSDKEAYLAQGLDAGTLHSLCVKTVDDKGNINENQVCISGTTDDLEENITQNFPYINIISPFDNLIYNSASILVNIDTNGTSVWYSIDNELPIGYTSPEFRIFSQGQHNITAFANNSQGNVNSTKAKFTVNILSVDLTPPGPISGLKVIEKSPAFLAWNWTNPSDGDFSHNLIYLQGILVASVNDFNYTANGLSSETSYTLCIKTVDTSGNINESQTCNTEKTSSKSSSNKKDRNRGPRILPSYNETKKITLASLTDEEPNEMEKKPVKSTAWNAFLTILLIGVFVVLLIIFVVLLVKSK